MAKRPSKSQRSWMAERMQQATDDLRESPTSKRDRERSASPTQVAGSGAFFDQIGGEEVGEGPEGEVFGAATGRGRRAISDRDLDDIEWDPRRAYPQIQTQSSNPERPRTVAAGYDPENRIIRVTFRNGSIYEYIGPEPRHWSAFQRDPSPGQYINRVLNQYPYRPLVD